MDPSRGFDGTRRPPSRTSTSAHERLFRTQTPRRRGILRGRTRSARLARGPSRAPPPRFGRLSLGRCRVSDDSDAPDETSSPRDEPVRVCVSRPRPVLSAGQPPGRCRAFRPPRRLPRGVTRRVPRQVVLDHASTSSSSSESTKRSWPAPGAPAPLTRAFAASASATPAKLELPAGVASELDAEESANVRLFRREHPLGRSSPTRCWRRTPPYSLDATEVPRGAGSGFVRDDAGHVVTTTTVVRDANEVTVKFQGDPKEYREGAGQRTTRTLAVVGGDHPRSTPSTDPSRSILRLDGRSEIVRHR